MAELMLRFEAIGIDCQFGAVQRCCGVEPLGLLRFTASSIENLTALLGTDFAEFLDAGDLGLELRAGEYMIYSRRYGDFFAHTNARAATQDAATVIARQSKKAAYLKKRFQLDWQAAERIYVHCGCDDEAAVRRLHAALRRRSDCWLLWVAVAEHPDERGRVEVLGPGLMKGCLAHAGGFNDWGFRSDLPGWAQVCRAAEAIVRRAPPPVPLTVAPIEARFSWASAQCGTVTCGPTVGNCRILHDCRFGNPVAQLTARAKFAGWTVMVLSVWVRLLPSFSGNIVMLTAKNAFPINYHPADVSLRDVWQQVWVVMKIPSGLETLTTSLDIEAKHGSDILFGGWQLEAGAIAGENLRPNAATVAPETHAVALPIPAPKPRGPSPVMQWIAALLRRAASRLDPESEAAAPSAEDASVFDCLRLSNVLMDKRRFDEADAVLAAGQSLYPWRAELYSHLGLCAEVRGDVPMAAARWSALIESFPQYALGHYRLAGTLREMGRTERALAVIEAALPRHLDDPALVSEAARVYATAHRWPEAVAHWERAVALADDKPEWRDARAHAARMAAKVAARFPPGDGSAIKA